MDRKDAYPWRYSLFLAVYYTANAVYQGFISVYFSGKGLDSAQIGRLMSAVPVVSMLTQPAWGALGDRSKSRNRVLRLLCLLAAGSILLLFLNDNLWYLFAVLCVFSASYSSIQPMGDSVILESLQARGHAFGPIRLLGCYPFAVASLVAGWVIDGHTDRIVWMTALILIGVMFSTYALPPTAGHERKKEKSSMRELYRDRTLMRLTALFTLLQVTMGYFYVFFPVYFTRLPGGTPALLGWAYFISAVSETPFLLLSDRLFDRLGAGRLLCVSAAALVARWIVLWLNGSVLVAMISQVLHGWGFIVMTVAMSKYVSLTVPEALRARGQMLLAIGGFGLARIAGNWGGGQIAQAIGLKATFGVMAAIALASLIAFGPAYMKKAPLNGRG